MSRTIDKLVTHAYLFTMEGDGVGYIDDGAVAIEGNTILEVGPTAELAPKYDAKETFDATDCAVLPGLIDAHMHTPLAILRGVAQDVAHWMQKALAPYSRHLDDASRLAGCKLNALEALRAGTTTHVEYTNPFEGWCEFYTELGVRARMTPMINAQPPGGMAGWKLGDVYPLDDSVGQRGIDKAFDLVHEFNGAHDGLVTFMMGPQAPDMLNKEQLLDIKRRSEREGLMIHMHVAQGDREIEQMEKKYGQRTPQYLRDIGYLDDQIMCVHLTEATEDEAAMIARTGASMCVCSGSIGIIDGIVPPAYAYHQAGGNVALGSDQACGNNCNNVWNEMKLTALFNKIRYRDPALFPAWMALRMATIEGARAIGLADEVGSLEAGKKADLILVDMTALNLMPVLELPVRNIVPNLVYAASSREVTTVIVDGQVLVRDGEILVEDEQAVIAEANRQAALVGKRVAADPVHKGMALLEAMDKGWL